MSGSKSSLARDNTMKVTAKEAMPYLFPAGGQKYAYFNTESEKLLKSQGIMKEDDSPSKPGLPRDGTMEQTAKEAKGILGKSKLGDTRQMTAKSSSKASKSPMKRGSTISKTVEEAQYMLGGKKVDITEARKTRSGGKRPLPPKPKVKRAGTMQKTAKEGKGFLNRTKGKGKK